MTGPPMKLGKHVEDPVSSDRIGGLPDDLLGRILSLLPTKCAVSTSILSKRWRFLFTLTTCLSFDGGPCYNHVGEENTRALQRFKEFVDKVLELHQISPIKKFSLLCQGSHENSDLNRWLSIALQKGVQEIHYDLADEVDCLADGFFSSETLVKVKMIGHGYNRFPIPPSACLPKLKILHLRRISFFDFDSMDRLFSSSELLEELTLDSCDCDNDDSHVVYRSGSLRVLTMRNCSFLSGAFEIDAPNLAYLTYDSNTGVNIVPSWKYSGSFVQAKLIFKCTANDEFDTHEDSVEYERDLLKAAAYKATELRFEMDSVQVLLMLDEYDDNEQMPDFDNLTKLELDNFPYEAWEYVTSLIDKSPRLETIIFDTGFRCCSCSNHYCQEDDVCYCDSLSLSDIPLDLFSCHAQVIEVHGFCAHKGSLALTGHLLRNASVLKKLIVYYDDLDLEAELKMSRELLMLPRASKDCRLEMEELIC